MSKSINKQFFKAIKLATLFFLQFQTVLYAQEDRSYVMVGFSITATGKLFFAEKTIEVRK